MADTITILLVDDEEYVVSALKRHIKWNLLGMEVVGEAYDGDEAIEKALQLHPDCIITDISMPKLDGISMIEQLYQMSSHPNFLIYTGYNDFEYAKKALSFGVSDYILKPALAEDFYTPLQTIGDRIS
jgi:two-component system response regulator YesN